VSPGSRICLTIESVGTLEMRVADATG